MAEAEQTTTNTPAVAPDTVLLPDSDSGESRSPGLKSGEVWNGRFLIHSVLGEGAAAVVYKATHIQLNLPMALKVLRPGHSQNAMKRFMREARLLSAFSHVNVVTLHSFGQEEQGLSFMALEFIEGPDLGQVIADEKFLEPSRAAMIARQICQALEAASVAEIVHRDLKPANIILSNQRGRGEHVKVIDFGIARTNNPQFQLDQSVTTAGFKGDSPAYMSPEQCDGRSVDARSDIYSVGCLLYEMVCGVPPFQDKSVLALMTAHVTQVVDSVPAQMEIPLSLRNIILKCLSKDPSARYQSAAELDSALAAINWDTMKMVKGAGQGSPGTSSLMKTLVKTLVCAIIIAALVVTVLQRQTPEPMNFRKTAVSGKGLFSKFLESRMTVVNFPVSERIVYYNQWLDKYGSEESLDCARAHFGLGQDLQTFGSTAGATEHYALASAIYRKAIADKRTEVGDLLDSYRDLGSILQLSGDKKGALVTYQQGLQKLGEKLSPLRKAHLHSSIAMAAIESRESNLAVENAKLACNFYAQAGRNGSDAGNAMLLYATSLALSGHRNHALAVVRQAEELMDQDWQASSKVGWLEAVARTYFDMGAFDQAAAKWQEAQEMGGSYSSSNAVHHLHSLIRQEKWNAARKAFNNILNRADGSSAADTWTALALVAASHDLLSDPKAVHAAVSAALAQQPDDPSERSACMRQMIAAAWVLRAGKNRSDEVKRILDAVFVLLEKDDLSVQDAKIPPSAESFLTVMNALLSNGEYDRAVKACASVQKSSRQKFSDADRALLDLTYACALRFSGRKDEATQSAQVVLAGKNSCEIYLLAAVAQYDHNDSHFKVLIAQATNSALRLKKEEIKSVLPKFAQLNLWALVHGDNELAEKLSESARLVARTTGGVTEIDTLNMLAGNYLFIGQYEKATNAFSETYRLESSLQGSLERRLGLLEVILTCARLVKNEELVQKYENLKKNVSKQN